MAFSRTIKTTISGKCYQTKTSISRWRLEQFDQEDGLFKFEKRIK